MLLVVHGVRFQRKRRSAIEILQQGRLVVVLVVVETGDSTQIMFQLQVDGEFVDMPGTR